LVVDLNMNQETGQKIHIYLIAGHGNDERLFYKIKWPEGFDVSLINMIPPKEEESITDYAQRLSNQVTAHPFIVLGVSLGGLLSIELAKFTKPEKIILVSSIKTKAEVPLYMRAAARFNARLKKRIKRKLLVSSFSTKVLRWLDGKPIILLKAIKSFVHILFLNLDKAEFNVYCDMIHDADPAFLVWAENEITNWQNEKTFENLVHIHGLKDEVFPVKYIRDFIPVKGGDHCMIVNKAATVSAMLKNVLQA
jgi:pimeloyl-ACP methyl ester carboxylesterase